MTTLKPFLVPVNEAGKAEASEDLRLFPEDFAVRVPAGATIVLQSHYVNVADRDLQVADVARFLRVPPGEEEAYTVASYFALNHGGIDVPPGAHTTSASCVLDRELRVIALLGHMHEHGRSIRIERERDGEVELLYEEDAWTVTYRDLPPVLRFAPEDPLVLEVGDELTVSCTYDNDTGAPLRFPQEMCAAFGTWFPAPEAGFFTCG